MRGALAACAVVIAVGTIPAPATADPLPTNKSEALKQLEELSKQTEQLAEQLHTAEDDLKAKEAEHGKSNETAKEARARGEQARQQEAALRVQVDKLAAASYQGARMNELSALLMSDSPSQFLDKMTVLDLMASDHKAAFDRLSGTIKQAEESARAADDAKNRAKKATDDAAKLRNDLAKHSDELGKRIKQVEEKFKRLSDDERKQLRGPELPPADVKIPPDSGLAGAALQKALTKQGSPYEWAAEGPNRFDCSGLIYWAYQQLGVTLPRGSSGQARAGVSVPFNAIKAGDLVAYSGHIGISVGGGNMLHAPQTGDVVKIAPLQKGIVAVRRIV